MRVPRQGKDQGKGSRPGEQRERGNRHRHRHRRPQGRWPWRRKPTVHKKRGKKPGSDGERPKPSLRQTFLRFWRAGDGTGGDGRTNKDTGSGGRGGRRGRRRSSSSSSSGSSNSNSRAKICPTSDEQADEGGVADPEAERPATRRLDGRMLDGLNGDVKRQGTGQDDQRQEVDEDEDRDNAELIDGSSSSSSSSSESEGEEEDSTDSNRTSDGEFAVDMDVVDDVTNDEGFELGEVRGCFLPLDGREMEAVKVFRMYTSLST